MDNKLDILEMLNSDNVEIRKEALSYVKNFMDFYKEADMITVKTNIRRLRKEKRLKLRQMADLSEMSEGVYINLENKSYKYKPTLDMILKIAHAHGCSLYEFIKPIE